MKKQWRDTALIDSIAAKLRELRERKGVSQETAYEDTGIHIGKVETAKYNITVSTISKLCAYYEIPIPDFFRELDY